MFKLECVYPLTQKLESTCSLWFKLHCQRWQTSEGYRQSCIL